MALRWSTSGRNGRNDDDIEEEDMENDIVEESTTGAGDSYLNVLLRPWEPENYNVILTWLGLHGVSTRMKDKRGTRSQNGSDSTPVLQIGVTCGLAALLGSLLLYQLIVTDLGFIFHTICGIIEPIFSIICAFYWIALYFRKSWSTTSVYVLFCSCFAGEFLGQCMSDGTRENYIMQPFLVMTVLVSVGLSSIFSTLETMQSTFIIAFVSFIRLLACTSLSDLPQVTRPFLAYFSGVAGVIAAKYMETSFIPPVSQISSQEAKIPVIKRRRSSSVAPHSFAVQRAGRRTSLPTLIQKPQTSSSSYESAIIGEAHGLISDMLADSSLPPHVVSGLNAVSNLLKPPESHGPLHKPRISPLVSLTETVNYGSDNEDLPYTGERPSSLPKRLRRSLPPSLIRRMSTSTWTTTTSATGLPTLEPEPCRTRSCSFRHSRDNTPGSSPTGSRSNSPSPSSPTTISLTIPKSRSFSSAATTGSGTSCSGAGLNNPPSSNQKRGSRDRRSFQMSDDSTTPSPIRGTLEKISPGPKSDPDTKQPSTGRILNQPSAYTGLSKRFNITSDYESNDSPSSSDHSDNVMSVDDIGPVTPIKASQNDNSSSTPQASSSLRDSGSESPAQPCTEGLSRIVGPQETSVRTTEAISPHHNSINAKSAVSPVTVSSSYPPTSPNKQQTIPPEVIDQSRANTDSSTSNNSSHRLCSEAGQLARETEYSNDVCDDLHGHLVHSSSVLPYSYEDVQTNKHMDISKVNQWDYGIFDLAADSSECILSMMACRLFAETGLFETFRIPTSEFIHYFHALELGYRNKPYHNRIHATDVLHGVYYLTTQPIPGFQQSNPDCDMFQTKTCSSESDSEGGERGCMRTNFTADDTYGIMGGNLPPLELMALYTSAAMHDYDHPGRTNAFLVTTNAPLAILYNDRSVLESHHAASAWRLYLSHPRYHWLQHLDKAEFKRFRFLVIEAILATDLKRHFELLAEFNAKVNDEDAPGIDWTSETDRLMVSNMVIKMADINGPAKRKDLHFNWTNRISEEFYEQGDEEASLGMPISPYMDRKHPQLAKLQESFINHLVAPLCNALGAAGLLPGNWVEGASDTDGTDTDKDSSTHKDTEDEEADPPQASPEKKKKVRPNKIHCWLTKNLMDNHDMWVAVLKQEAAQKERENKQTDEKKESRGSLTLNDKDSKQEMEPITEEDTPPNSAHSVGEELAKVSDRLHRNQASPTHSSISQSESSHSTSRQ